MALVSMGALLHSSPGVVVVDGDVGGGGFC